MIDGRKYTVKEKFIRTEGKTGKYVSVCLNKLEEGRRKRERDWLVHRLVLEAFVGPCPKGMECRHLDDNGHNNRLDNLCWGTVKQNTEDRMKHGKTSKGVKGNTHKLKGKEEEVLKVVASGKYSFRKVAQMYGVHYQTIRYLLDKNKHRKGDR